jgi:membrane dipeptidase
MYPSLTAALIRKGYSDEQIAGIIGGNVLRVLKGVEDTAARLQAAGTPPAEQTVWYEVPGNCRSLA